MKPTFKHTVIACYLGYLTQAIIVNLAPILFIVFQDKFQISFEMIGRLILINFGTQLITDAVAVRYADRIGIRTSILLAHILAVLGLVALGVLPNILPVPYTGLVIASIIYAVGGGLIEVLVSPIVDAIPGDAKDSAMSLLHSFYAWGQVAVVLLSTLFVKLVGADRWYLLPMLWAFIPLLNLINFTRVPLMPAVPEHDRTPLTRLLGSKIFILAMLLMVCAGASEQAIAQWSSLFAEKGLQVPKLTGDLLGPCAFATMMGIGRVFYGIWGEKINLKFALLACSFLCVSCYMVTVFVPNPFISLVGVALSGLAVSIMWPGMLRMVSKNYPLGGTAMFGVLAIMGDLGCSLGPWIAGAVSDAAQASSRLVQLGITQGLNPEQIGLKSGIFAAVIFPLIMLMGVGLFKNQANETVSEPMEILDTSHGETDIQRTSTIC